jgi:hypothetical protein
MWKVFSSRFAQWFGRAPALVAVTLLSSCAAEDEGVTYSENIRPIFDQRCVICHLPQTSWSRVDIQNPYSTRPIPEHPEYGVQGLAVSQNQWKLLHPAEAATLPDQNVAEGDPDNSFLLDKVSGPSSGLLPPDPDGDGPQLGAGGAPMPLLVPRLAVAQVNLIEDWVRAGAPDASQVFLARDPATCPTTLCAMRNFAIHVQPIFGEEDKLRRSNGVCNPNEGFCGRCVLCHYKDTPNEPDLSDPFGPRGLIFGTVPIEASYRSGINRVQPGDPENSLLIHKIRAEAPSSDYGPQMPYSFDPLSRTQVDLVRQWIAEGARP